MQTLLADFLVKPIRYFWIYTLFINKFSHAIDIFLNKVDHVMTMENNSISFFLSQRCYHTKYEMWTCTTIPGTKCEHVQPYQVRNMNMYNHTRYEMWTCTTIPSTKCEHVQPYQVNVFSKYHANQETPANERFIIKKRQVSSHKSRIYLVGPFGLLLKSEFIRYTIGTQLKLRFIKPYFILFDWQIR